MGIGTRVRQALERTDRFQQRHPWLAVPVAVVRTFGDDRADRHAALIAYYGFISVFPLLLVLVTLLGFAVRNDPELQQRVLDSALAQFPIIGEQMQTNIRALNGSVVALALGLAGAIWSGLAVISATRVAMDEIWDVPRRDQPSFVRARLLALAGLAVLGLAILVQGLLAGLGGSDGSAWTILRLAASVAINVAVFAAVFRVLTVADVRWRTVVPGALLGGCAWTALLLAGSWLVDRQIRDASQVYGFFAIVIGLLAWIYLGAQVMLLSAELNVVLARRLWPRSLLGGEDATSADRRVVAGEAKEEAAHPDETVDVRFDGGDEPAPSDERAGRV
jgi:YihY family inner membrane protein